MISVIIPVFNEEKNINILHNRLVTVLNSLNQEYEIIIVDDGSTDSTFDEIKKLSPVRAFRFPVNRGQTAAILCGINNVKGDITVTIDGDLENRPEDIPLLIDKINEGFDAVAGWRRNRWQEKFINRKIPSLLANKLINRITRSNIHDHGCGLKAFKTELVKNTDFRGDMHRMLFAYLALNDVKITEVPVEFENRKFEKSKYGFSRSITVLLDLIGYYFYRSFSDRPIHFFGYSGFICISLSIIMFLWSLYLKFVKDIDFDNTPLPELIVILVVVGFQFLLLGLFAEIMIRTNSKPVYSEKSSDIKEVFENL